MNIKFNSLCIENFLSFKSAQLDLSNNGYVLVQGKNNNSSDNALSNGSGKSSIWEAISWCLTGQTIRGTKDVHNIYSEGKTSVELRFFIDDDSYIVTRTLSPSNLKLIVNDKDVSGKGIRDTEKILAQYLPDLTSQLIGSVIILGQGLPQRFSNNTPSGRKDVLEKLSKSDFMIEDLKVRISNRKSELQDMLRSHEDKITALAATSESLSLQLHKQEKLLEELKPVNEEDLNSFRRLQKESQEALNSTALPNIREKIDAVKSSISLLDTDYYEAVRKIESAYSTSIREKEATIVKCDTEIKSINQEIKRLESIKDVCPTCGQKLPGVVKPDTSSQREEVNKLQELRSVCDDELSSLKRKEQDEINSEKQKLHNAKLDLEKNLRALLDEELTENSRIRDLNRNLEFYTSNIIRLETQKENYKTLKDQYESAILDLNEKIDALEKERSLTLASINDTQEHVSIVNKMNSSITREFRGYLLINVIDYIDKRAKKYSSRVFGNNNITLKLEGNNIDIIYQGKEYSCLSGGEKQKVDLIVQFAIRDMLCSYLNFSSNIIVLDEIFDNLDNLGCQKILDLISEELTDIQTVYVITHHSDISIPYDSEIIVLKNEEGISSVLGQ